MGTFFVSSTNRKLRLHVCFLTNFAGQNSCLEHIHRLECCMAGSWIKDGFGCLEIRKLSESVSNTNNSMESVSDFVFNVNVK